MKQIIKPLAVATISIATLTSAYAAKPEPQIGSTMTFDRSPPACTSLEDAKLAGFYWWKNSPFLQTIMQKRSKAVQDKSTTDGSQYCIWLKVGIEYEVREIADAGFDSVFCLSTEDDKDHCFWFLRPKGGDFYAPQKEMFQRSGRTWLEPGNVFYLKSALLGCIDLIDAADAKWTEQTGVRMTRTNRPKDSPSPDCKYLMPGVQFTIVKIDDQLMGMARQFRKLCLRQTTSSESDACRWGIVLVD
jgi:hypothetical protein